LAQYLIFIYTTISASKRKIKNLIEKYHGQYNSKKDFTTLAAWKYARELKIFFYVQVLPKIHSEEKLTLGHQIRKTLISITANIAEGYGRFHYKEGIQFYRVSRASLYELKDHLITCYDLNYINRKLLVLGIKKIEKTKITLNGYISFTKNRTKTI
jgi:four helix bundle protein